MSGETGQTELRRQTHELLQGPLKHIRGAALAAALVPLASVLAAPASAQSTGCPSAGVCGTVFDDANHNGIQDAGETGIEGVKVFVIVGADTVETETNQDGLYYFATLQPGTYSIIVRTPTGTQPSPANVGGNDTVDSDGISDGFGNSVATMTYAGGANSDTDFGFSTSSASNPGTGTPGYWKKHPDAWPVDTITVGNMTYTRDEAIAWLGRVGKDKTTTMFSSLVPAMLNVMIGNDGGCVTVAIQQANLWMTAYGPVGSNVAASSPAWTVGEPLHRQMDAYNNGRLCAPHRQ